MDKIDIHTAFVDGFEIRYLQFGERDDYVVFGLGYSFPCTSFITNHLQIAAIEEIAKHFTVIIPEIPGINFPCKSMTSSRDFVNLYHQFLREKKVESHYAVGHSYGAQIQLLYACEPETTIKKLIAFNPPLPISHGLIKHIFNYTKMNFRELAGVVGDDPDQVRKVQKHNFNILPFFLKNLLRSANSFHILKEITEFNLIEWIPNIPTLYFFSLNDELFQLGSDVESILTEKTNIKLISKKGFTHNSRYYYPDYFKDIILSFLIEEL